MDEVRRRAPVVVDGIDDAGDTWPERGREIRARAGGYASKTSAELTINELGISVEE